MYGLPNKPIDPIFKKNLTFLVWCRQHGLGGGPINQAVVCRLKIIVAFSSNCRGRGYCWGCFKIARGRSRFRGRDIRTSQVIGQDSGWGCFGDTWGRITPAILLTCKKGENHSKTTFCTRANNSRSQLVATPLRNQAKTFFMRLLSGNLDPKKKFLIRSCVH